MSNAEPLRAILPLLKAPISLGPNHITIHIGAAYGSPTTIRIPLDMSRYDIREGDVLTIYTEVLLKGAATDA